MKVSKDENDKLVNATFCKQIITSLRYLCNTRPDIWKNGCLVSRFMEKPRSCHLLASKRILRYIKGTLDHGILVLNQKNTSKKVKIYGYLDSIVLYFLDPQTRVTQGFLLYEVTSGRYFCVIGGTHAPDKTHAQFHYLSCHTLISPLIHFHIICF